MFAVCLNTLKQSAELQVIYYDVGEYMLPCFNAFLCGVGL